MDSSKIRLKPTSNGVGGKEPPWFVYRKLKLGKSDSRKEVGSKMRME